MLDPELEHAMKLLGSTVRSMVVYAANLVPPEIRNTEREHWLWFYGQRIDNNFGRLPNLLRVMLAEHRVDIVEDRSLRDDHCQEIKSRRENLDRIENELDVLDDAFRIAATALPSRPPRDLS